MNSEIETPTVSSLHCKIFFSQKYNLNIKCAQYILFAFFFAEDYKLIDLNFLDLKPFAPTAVSGKK